MKKLLFLLLSLSVFVYAQVDARTRAYIQAVLADTAEVLRDDVSDTATTVRATIRGEFADSVDGVARTVDSSWTFNNPTYFNDASVWLYDDTLFLTDGGADTSYIVQDGSYLKIGGDNQVYIYTTLRTRWISPYADTLYYSGTIDGYRWKEVNALHYIASSPDKTDSLDISYNANDTAFFRVDTDGKFRFNNDVRFDENIYADTTWGEIDTTGTLIQTAMTNNAMLIWTDSSSVLRGEMTDSANDVWNDSAVVILRENGSNPLTADWAAGDFDITGLEALEADTVTATIELESPRWLMGTGGVSGTGTIVGTALNSADIYVGVGDADSSFIGDGVVDTDSLCFEKLRCNTTAAIIDSFKLNAAEDSLWIYLKGKRFVAVGG